jgi:putative transposase
MVRYRRVLVPGATYFFTVNLRDRQSCLLTEHIDLFRRAVSETRKSMPFTIDAMVVMPNHWHALWTLPADDKRYLERIRLVKAKFTKALIDAGVDVNKDRRGECNVWQKRFWEHTIRDSSDYEAHVNYVHINPVKHGYAARASDWPHSSIHRFIQDGILSVDWACEPSVENSFGE